MAEPQVQEQQMFSWSEKVLTTLYWSELDSYWKWTVTRQVGGEWTRWAEGRKASFERAVLALMDALEALLVEEGSPF